MQPADCQLCTAPLSECSQRSVRIRQLVCSPLVHCASHSRSLVCVHDGPLGLFRLPVETRGSDQRPSWTLGQDWELLHGEW